MPVGVVKNARDESLWEAAKKAAKKGGYEGDSLWAVTMKIFQNMKHSKEHIQ
jgi:hypothetical protein